MAQYDSKADFKVHEMRSMGKSRDAEAMELLRRISHQVQPIMRRREWRVPLLTEFFPANGNLLGLNIGGGGGRTREIKVRLRPARNPDSFLPYESILGTMLHELVHNVRGPHDGAFYKLLDEITSECEDLMARGVGGTGVGFDGPSCGRLGSHAFIPLHDPGPGRLRDCALRAAEERAKRQRLMPAGPRRLGGSDGGPLNRYMTAAEAAAAAAERRCRDNRWCPCERLAGAVSRAVARAVARADVQLAAQGEEGGGGRGGGAASATHGGTAAGGPGATAAAHGAGRTGSGAPHVSAVPSASPTSASASAAAASCSGAPAATGLGPGDSAQPPHPGPLTSAEVEAKLVRRLEEGVIDLTLDCDSDPDSDPDLELEPAPVAAPPGAGGRAGPAGIGGHYQQRPAGCGWPFAGTAGGTGPAAALPKVAAETAAAAGADVGSVGPGPRSGAGCRLRSGPAGGSRGVDCSSRGGGAGAAAVTQSGASGLLPLKCERPAGGLGATGGNAASGPQVQQQQGRAVGASAAAAAAATACPPARPPLQALQPRNPAAAAAAAAALARMQQHSWQQGQQAQEQQRQRQGQEAQQQRPSQQQQQGGRREGSGGQLQPKPTRRLQGVLAGPASSDTLRGPQPRSDTQKQTQQQQPGSRGRNLGGGGGVGSGVPAAAGGGALAGHAPIGGEVEVGGGSLDLVVIDLTAD